MTLVFFAKVFPPEAIFQEFFPRIDFLAIELIVHRLLLDS